jgi:hypothetical protein
VLNSHSVGNHGDGEKVNTETPMVMWGAGIRGVQSAERIPQDFISDYVRLHNGSLQGLEESWTVSSPLNWRLNHLRRVDIEQASIAPLMSSLIGVPFPLNSVGVLPLPLLETDLEWNANNIVANLRQIYALTLRYHGTLHLIPPLLLDIIQKHFSECDLEFHSSFCSSCCRSFDLFFSLLQS